MFYRVVSVRTPAGGHSALVASLLEHGGLPNALDELGWTSLHIAVSGGHAEIAGALLTAGGEKTSPFVCLLFMLKMLILPRQARDTHRKKLPKLFLQATRSLLTAQGSWRCTTPARATGWTARGCCWRRAAASVRRRWPRSRTAATILHCIAPLPPGSPTWSRCCWRPVLCSRRSIAMAPPPSTSVRKRLL